MKERKILLLLLLPPSMMMMMMRYKEKRSPLPCFSKRLRFKRNIRVLTPTTVRQVRVYSNRYASDATIGDGFGRSVSLYGDTSLIGVLLDDDGDKSDCGPVHVCTRSIPD